MSVSSTPAVIDWLVTNIAALDACQGAHVSDGFPSQRANDLVVIGVSDLDEGADVTLVYAELGTRSQVEEYDVPILVSVHRGSADQKQARDRAFAILDAIRDLVRADPLMSTDDVPALNGGRYASLTQVQMVQTNTPEEAGTGRTCYLYVRIRCQNKF